MAVPLDVDIEMTQLISDAFRRRDAAAAPDPKEVAGGQNNAGAPETAAEEDDDVEGLLSEESDECGDSDGGGRVWVRASGSWRR